MRLRASPAARTDGRGVAKGKRLAKLYGCSEGCHGKGIEGAVQYDQLMVGRVVAPNLTSAVRRYSDPELAAIIRTGVRPDGHNIIMMSEFLRLLTDEELGDIVAYLRSVPAVEGPGPEVRLGPGGSFLYGHRAVYNYGPVYTGGHAAAAGERGRRAAWPPSCQHRLRGLSRLRPQRRCAVGRRDGGAATAADHRCVHTGGLHRADAQRRPRSAGASLTTCAKRRSAPLSVLTQAQIDDLYSYLRELPCVRRRGRREPVTRAMP